MKNQIVALKINRNQAGVKIPYDKLYFVCREDRDLIPKTFEYALVLPVSDDLVAQIFELVPKTVSVYQHRRNDHLLKQPTCLDGRSLTTREQEAWWRTNFIEKYDLLQRVAVVPVLLAHKRKRALPRYLTSRRWMSSVQNRDNTGVHEYAYVATPLSAPHDKIQPICNMCPRQLLQLTGACTPGDEICYRSLDFNAILSDEELKEQDNARV